MRKEIAKRPGIPKTPRPGAVATINTNILLPKPLYDAMKVIQQARKDAESADVRLCRIYREAVEQYVQAEPQQRLLKNGHRMTRTA